MTAPDSFATIDDAAAYGYVLPAAAAAGLLARATQAIRDEAGIPLTVTTSTLEVRASCGLLELPGPLVTSVTGVQLVTDDGAVDVSDWHFEQSLGHIRLGHTALTWHQRHRGLYSVTYVHGFAVIPASLILLTARVAARLSVTPAGATAGLQSKTVGAVSWTVSSKTPPSDDLSEGECAKLARIVPLRRAWMVPMGDQREAARR